jgi:release factor glutamine methyltransferase
MPSVSEILLSATEVLKESEIVEPRREANSLLGFALQKDLTFLIAHPEYELTQAERQFFHDCVNRRAAHEPFQHITGKQEFYGLDFIVSPDALIPRPETELIVAAAIEILSGQADPVFCEVGVGSGCIAISVLHHVKAARAVASDISEAALRIAAQNAAKHQVTKRLKLLTSDGFNSLPTAAQFDLIVSNPPYVPKKDIETLQAEVRDHDPLIALTDGADGLSIIKKLIVESPKHLKPGGFLLLEIGYDQAESVQQMIDSKVWKSANFMPDLQGIPRMAKLRLA